MQDEDRLGGEAARLRLRLVEASLGFASLRESVLALIFWVSTQKDFSRRHAADYRQLVLSLADGDERLTADVLDDGYDYAALLADWAWCRLVDSLNSFLQDAVELALIQTPEHLATDAQVKLREVLGCTSMEEFIAHRAALRARQESRDDSGLLAFASSLGLPTCESEEEQAFLEYAIAVRHCLVHNNGRPDERFLRSHVAAGLPEGPLRLSLDDIPRFSMRLYALSGRVERALGLEVG